MRVKHKVIFLKGKISLGKKKLGKIDIFFSVKKLLCLLYKVAWKGWKSWWLYPESPYYQKHQERGEKLLEFRRKLHIDLNESLLLVVFHVSWCICLWRSFFPNNFPTLCLFFWLNITLEQLVTQLVYKCFHTRRPRFSGRPLGKLLNCHACLHRVLCICAIVVRAWTTLQVSLILCGCWTPAGLPFGTTSVTSFMYSF